MTDRRPLDQTIDRLWVQHETGQVLDGSEVRLDDEPVTLLRKVIEVWSGSLQSGSADRRCAFMWWAAVLMVGDHTGVATYGEALTAVRAAEARLRTDAADPLRNLGRLEARALLADRAIHVSMGGGS